MGGTYSTFTRTWWREAEGSDGEWPDNLVPCAGDRTYTAEGISQEKARAMCKEYNLHNDPGRYSLKMEYEQD